MPFVPDKQADPLDFTDRYNTQLSPEQEQTFQKWAKSLGRQGSSYDYDLRGAFASGAAQSANGHFPDTFKKPNHPTFSDQSKYSGVDGYTGGTWAKQADGSWTFAPTESVLKLHDPQALQDYFSKVEPGNKLVLPPPKAVGRFVPDRQPAQSSVARDPRAQVGDAVLKTARTLLTPGLGGYEAAAQAATGMVAAPVAGLVGIGQGLKNLVSPGMSAGDRVEQVADALTYQPRTQSGRDVSGIVNAPTQALARGADVAGEAVSRGTGSPAAGAATNTAIQALPMILLRGRGKAGGVAEDVSRPSTMGRSAAGAEASEAPAAATAERPPRLAQVPTKEELGNAASDAYKRAEDSGAVITEDSFGKARDALVADLRKDGLNEKLHPDATAALESITETKGPVSLQQLETLRKIAKDAQGSVKPADQRMAGKIVDAIDDFSDSLTDKDFHAGSPEAVAALKDARDYYSRNRKAEAIDEMVDRAETRAGAHYTQAGMEHALRQEFKTLALNKKRLRLFTPEEQGAIKGIARGGAMENALRNLGKFDPTSGGMAAAISSLLAGGGAAATGGLSLLLPVAGFGAKRLATRMTAGKVGQLHELVRSGKPIRDMSPDERRQAIAEAMSAQ